MRPLRLEVEAFGPFATRQVVDFDALGDDGLFLIWGPTGGGKSFLLDALCFALFGKTAGDRPMARLHSDHARQGTPEVVLDFRLGMDEWRVTRRAARWRTRRDGTPTQDTTRAVLERSTAEGYEVVATKVTDVDRILADRIGLTVEEFRRVVVLPQGRFEQVLRASSGEREQLLKTVFGTTVFEDVTHSLEEAARKEAHAIDGADHDQQMLRSAALAEVRRLFQDVAPARGGLGSQLDLVLADLDGVVQDDAGSAAVDQRVLDRWVVLLSSAEAELAEASDVLGRTAVSARDEAARVETMAASWDERSRLQARLVELDGEAAEVDRLRREIGAVTRALPVQPALAAAERAASVLGDAVSAQAVAAASLSRAIAASRLALPALPPADPTRAVDAAEAVDDEWLRTAGAAVVTRTGEVARAAEQAGRAATLRQQAEAARRDLADHERAAGEQQTEALALRQRGVEAHARLGQAQVAAGRVDGLIVEAEHLTRSVAASRDLAVVDDQVAAATRRQLQCREAEADARLAFADLRQLQLDGMAGEMALTLSDGAPCPVCGSDAHPTPAPPLDGAPSRAEVDRAETIAAAAANRRAEADDALVELHQRQAQLRAQAGSAAESGHDVLGRLERVRAALAQATTASGGLAALRSEIAELEQGARVVADAASDHAERASVARAQAEAFDIQADETGAEAVRLLGPEIDPAESGAALDDLETIGALLGELAQARTAVSRATAAEQEARIALHDALGLAELPDAESAREALRSRDEIARLTARVEAWGHEHERVRIGLEHPTLAALPGSRPDPGPAAVAAEQAAAQQQSVVEARVRVRDAARLVADTAADHRRLEDDLVVARAEHEVRHRLAEACAGRGGDRVSLQRWVLASHFATVCGRANARLAVMTAGRYSLLVHTGSTRGAATGLDLRVHDAHTGESREVTSLSGGETFQASLALALGVADVVGERSGGIDLGVLFVDEGFGTLDPDVLQLALDELDELRAGGRMVGVISHVAGLRERIRAGIEVRSGPTGSQVLVGG